MSALKFLIPAITLAAVAVAGTAQAAGGQCQNTLALSGWTSDGPDNGTYMNRVYVRNLTRGMVRVTVGYSGAGETGFPSKTLQPNSGARMDIVRTSEAVSTETLSANTRVGCSIVG